MQELLTARGGRVLLDRSDIQQVLRQMADAILALSWPDDDHLPEAERPRPWLIGIHRGGVPVAEELADILSLSEGWRPLVGSIDVTMYRDDTWLKGPAASEGRTNLPGDPTGQRVVLIDDVLHTGRTIRAALNVLVDFGRPEAVRLGVLVDRGERELPIAADVVGQAIQVARNESVQLACDAAGSLARVIVMPRG